MKTTSRSNTVNRDLAMVTCAPGMAGTYRPARDQAWKSNGSGVVYEPARGVSRRKFRALQIERVCRDQVWAAAGEWRLLTVVR